MNPFDKTAHDGNSDFLSKVSCHALNKYDADVQTRARIILSSAVIDDAHAFSHALSRSVNDRTVFKELSFMRDTGGKARQLLSLLMPKNESVTERAIFCEQLEIELAAELANRKIHKGTRTALKAVLVDDLDHLYRFSNLLHLTCETPAEKLVPCDILPTRPTWTQTRPIIKTAGNFDGSDVMTTLAVMTMTAAKRYISNFYTTSTSLPADELSRKLLAEIALAEECHFTRCESLLPYMSTFERLLVHTYCECYVLWSCYMTEIDDRVKRIFEKCLSVALDNLKSAAELLNKYEGKQYDEVISPCEFPPPLTLAPNNDRIRSVLASTDLSAYSDELQDHAAPSNKIIRAHIDKYGNDYRHK